MSGDLLGEDPFCSYQPQNSRAVETAAITWDDLALARVQRIPGFIRDRVKQGIEGFARSRGYTTVDTSVLEEAFAAMGSRAHHRR